MNENLGIEFKGKSQGWGPWRREWYSICSRHHDPHTDCHMCMTGHYSYVVLNHMEHFFYTHFYRLWHWWVNRPNSASRKRIETIFPKLKQ
jgi:hypothetical protein